MEFFGEAEYNFEKTDDEIEAIKIEKKVLRQQLKNLQEKLDSLYDKKYRHRPYVDNRNKKRSATEKRRTKDFKARRRDKNSYGNFS